MDTLILEDFRCFAGRNEVPIRPLTLLVGENSTGKTSFLAAVRAAHDRTVPDFNEPPFHLGSYGQIANYRGGRTGRARSFMVGQRFRSTGSRLIRAPRRQPEAASLEMRIEAHFISDRAQPAISLFAISSGGNVLELKDLDSAKPVAQFSAGDKTFRERRIRVDEWLRALTPRGLGAFLASFQVWIEEEGSTDLPQEEFDWRSHPLIDAIQESMFFQTEPRPSAFAPIRTSPQRTYEPVKEIRDPEGSHTPMMLARLLESSDASDFRDQIEQFGTASGLYSSLGIRKLGRSGSDPFQIEVKHPQGGRARNLVDVGYGVSQAIPIIADAVSTARGATLAPASRGHPYLWNGGHVEEGRLASAREQQARRSRDGGGRGGHRSGLRAAFAARQVLTLDR